MAECIRLLIDISGGYVADLPSDRDFENPEIGGLLKKYLKGAAGVPVDTGRCAGNLLHQFRICKCLQDS